MGAWGTGNFDNDTACDWAYDLEKSSDLSVITKALEAVFHEEYIDSDIACEALAAVDTIARLKGKIGVKNSYTEAVDAWVEKNQLSVPDELIAKSIKALELIGSENSELFELWEESGESGNWKKELVSLKERISG